MKFISKLLWNLLMENLSFSDPHLYKIVSKIYNQKETNISIYVYVYVYIYIYIKNIFGKGNTCFQQVVGMPFKK